MITTAILTQKYREDTDRKEWALVSRKDRSKVLKWFGQTKPSQEVVDKEERRVQYFKHASSRVKAFKAEARLIRIFGAENVFTLDDARSIGDQLGINWDEVPFSVEEFLAGLYVELEHGTRWPETDVTNNDPLLTGKIAWAHLKELPDYYVRLAEMEKEGKAALER